MTRLLAAAAVCRHGSMHPDSNCRLKAVQQTGALVPDRHRFVVPRLRGLSAFLRSSSAAFGLILAFSGALPVYGQASVTEKTVAPGVTHVFVKTNVFELEFEPEKAAQAVSFKTRFSPNEWSIPITGGLFRDNFVGQGYPGELPKATYTYEILEKGPEQVVVQFQTLSKDKLLITRRMIFAADSPVVRVILGMTNQAERSQMRGLWPKWDFYVSGVREQNLYFRPDVRGLNPAGWNPTTKLMGGEDFVKRPFAGWTGALNGQTGEGLVWLMDYNWLMWLYNCNSAWTVEWFYDNIALPPGERWETEYDMLLVKGFRNFSHGSRNLIAGTIMEPKKKFEFFGPGTAKNPEFLLISHTFARSLAGDIKSAKIAAEVRGVDTGEEYMLPEAAVENVGWEPKTVAQPLADVDMEQRLVCHVVLTGTLADGKPFKEEYEYYWPGSKGEKFDLLAGTTATTYFRKPPKKVKVYSKPKELVLKKNTTPQAVEFRGLFHQYFKVPDAAAKAGITNLKDSFFSTVSFAGSSLSYFPSSYDEMLSYNLLILNNVDAASLTDFGLEAIRDYVRAGGAVLVLGGQWAYGPGGYAETQLADFLPVTLTGKSLDMQALTPPGVLKITPGAKLLAGMTLKQPGVCLWQHDLKPKADAWVELNAGDRPFLVCGRFGKGRVAAVTGTVCGDPGKDNTAFWDSPDWPDILSRTIRWLVTAE